jgi:peptidoglycan pentaglycine glycine transferase (the first glycine)
MQEYQVHRLEARHRDLWDRFVARSPHFALMQSYAWGELKADAGCHTTRIVVQCGEELVAGAQMLVYPLPGPFGSVAYIPCGPLLDWTDFELARSLLDALHRAARAYRAIFLKVEPPLLHHPDAHAALCAHGFVASAQMNNPRCTLTLDLDRDLTEVLRGLQKRTRYGVRYARRHGVKIVDGDLQDIDIFYRLLKETSERKHFPIRSRDYYARIWRAFAGRTAALKIAMYQDRYLSAALAFAFGDQAAYLYGASSDEHRELMPSYLLQWELIKWAHSRGCHTYDLWGIPDKVGQYEWDGQEPPDPGRTDDLWGVYQFKRGFGRDVVFYVGAYDYVYTPLWYRLANLLARGLNLGERLHLWLDRVA